MPRYFFDIHDGIVVLDTTGIEMADLEAAHVYGMKIVSGYAAKPGMIGIEGGVIVVVIRDAPASVLMKLRLVFNIEDLTAPGR